MKMYKDKANKGSYGNCNKPSDWKGPKGNVTSNGQTSGAMPESEMQGPDKKDGNDIQVRHYNQ